MNNQDWISEKLGSIEAGAAGNAGVLLDKDRVNRILSFQSAGGLLCTQMVAGIYGLNMVEIMDEFENLSMVVGGRSRKEFIDASKPIYSNLAGQVGNIDMDGKGKRTRWF